MSNVAIIDPPKSITTAMAERYGMTAKNFEQTLRATVVPRDITTEQFAAFCLVAKEYDLNPILKEIYAFPTKGGGIQPIVGIDGWVNLINSHPSLDGIEFEDEKDEKTGGISAITCRIYRKDRSRPVEATEYMKECARKTEPWEKWPRRMLRHKALIQAARYAFGFAGIIDPDEWERSPEKPAENVVVAPPAPPPAIEPPNEAKAEQIEEMAQESIPSGFYDELEAAMIAAMDEADVEQVWSDHDVLSVCADDLTVATAIRDRRLQELGIVK